MVFNVFLTGFGIFMKTGLKVASYRDPAFRKRLREKDFLVQIRLMNANKSGYLLLRDGRLKSGRQVRTVPPDILVEWSDVSTALRSMLRVHPRALVESMHREIASGRLRVEFNVASSVWFLSTVRQLLVVLSGSKNSWPL